MIEFSAFDFDENDKKAIYVEAVEYSTTVRDIEIHLFYNGKKEDEVTITAVWAAQTTAYFTRDDSNGGNNTNNPVPGQGVLSNLNETTLINRINTCYNSNTNMEGFVASNTTRYGHGISQWICSTAPAKHRIFGGKILIVFQTYPIDLLEEENGQPSPYENMVHFDVTRQIKSVGYGWKTVGMQIEPLDSKPATNYFPWEEENSQIRDNETPTDDKTNDDEDNIPFNSYIYSWDVPSFINKKSSGNSAPTIQIKKHTFKEFVRIKLGEEGFGDENVTDDDGYSEVEGSRASDRWDWHCVNYARNNYGLVGNNYVRYTKIPKTIPPTYVVGYDFDRILPTNLSSGQGILVTLKNSTPEQKAYKLKFKNNVWTITKNGGGFTDSFSPPSSGTFVYTGHPDFDLQILDALQYDDDDTFYFSIFKSDNVENNILNGFYDVEMFSDP